MDANFLEEFLKQMNIYCKLLMENTKIHKNNGF